MSLVGEVLDRNPSIILEEKATIQTYNDDNLFLGITVQGIEAFINVNGKREHFLGKTVNDVSQIIQDLTKASGKFYCEAFKDLNTQTQIANATVYISLAWKTEFLDVIDALKDWVKDGTPTVFWFDLFSLSQPPVPKV